MKCLSSYVNYSLLVGVAVAVALPVQSEAQQSSSHGQVGDHHTMLAASYSHKHMISAPNHAVLDINGDGVPDILFQNMRDGTITYWLMQGRKRGAFGHFQGPNASDWKLVGTPDLYGNGKPVLLWQNQKTSKLSFWTFSWDPARPKGMTRTGKAYLTAQPPKGWDLVSTPDLNADGKPDFLFQNQSTGTVDYWIMDGLTRTKTGTLTGDKATGLKVMATRDLNGDGTIDILFQNPQSGAVSYWMMHDLNHTSYGSITQSISPNWVLAGAIDFNGDGKTDLLFQDKNTGHINYWMMNGTTRASSGTLTNDVRSSWKLVGLR